MIQKILSKLLSKPDEARTAKHNIETVATALMIEVMKADHDHLPIEAEKLHELTLSAFSLSHAETDALICKARNMADDATSLWEYTDLINKECKAEQKFQLIVAMWKMAFADGSIDRYEEHLIRRVSDLIYVPHVNFIEAKHKAGILI